jgi:hypothetical protein
MSSMHTRVNSGGCGPSGLNGKISKNTCTNLPISKGSIGDKRAGSVNEFVPWWIVSARSPGSLSQEKVG